MAKLAVQLYTLRELMQKDFVQGLREAAKIGYEGVEFAGYGDMSADSLRDLCTELHLSPVSSHVSLERLEANLDEEIRYAKVLGLEFVVCPWLPEERRANVEGYQQLCQSLDKIGKRLNGEGIKFAYHNHAFEFEKIGDTYALDYIFESTSPALVQTELDVYWVEYAGESAPEYLKRYSNRCSLIHMKDMDKTDRSFAEVGKGSLNISKIIQSAEEAGVKWFIVEQDYCKTDPVGCIRDSYAYLSGQAKL